MGLILSIEHSALLTLLIKEGIVTEEQCAASLMAQYEQAMARL